MEKQMNFEIVSQSKQQAKYDGFTASWSVYAKNEIGVVTACVGSFISKKGALACARESEEHFGK